jgi:hypothetical protein
MRFFTSKNTRGNSRCRRLQKFVEQIGQRYVTNVLYDNEDIPADSSPFIIVIGIEDDGLKVVLFCRFVVTADIFHLRIPHQDRGTDHYEDEGQGRRFGGLSIVVPGGSVGRATTQGLRTG